MYSIYILSRFSKYLYTQHTILEVLIASDFTACQFDFLIEEGHPYNFKKVIRTICLEQILWINLNYTNPPLLLAYKLM